MIENIFLLILLQYSINTGNLNYSSPLLIFFAGQKRTLVRDRKFVKYRNAWGETKITRLLVDTP